MTFWEQQIANLARSWSDDLHRELVNQVGEESGNRLFSSCQPGFPVSYQQDWSPRQGAHDLRRLNQAEQSGELGILLTRPGRFRAVQRGAPTVFQSTTNFPLSDILAGHREHGVLRSTRNGPIRFNDMNSLGSGFMFSICWPAATCLATSKAGNMNLNSLCS
ncbi:MAG: hypothetical protein CM1200mP20_01540 [Pseudomonadota bacterium]|nr:MAG: hypothetical protein CM1200mP20_01540 [Pseudomonadota bacterium]